MVLDDFFYDILYVVLDIIVVLAPINAYLMLIVLKINDAWESVVVVVVVVVVVMQKKNLLWEHDPHLTK